MFSRHIKKSKGQGVPHFDETTNSQLLQQLDIKIRCWSIETRRASFIYLIGHARGQQLTDRLLCSIKDNGLMLDKFLAIESDGPNVNKTVKNKSTQIY